MSESDTDFSYVSEVESSDWTYSSSGTSSSLDSDVSDVPTNSKRPKLAISDKSKTEWVWQKNDNVPQIKKFVAKPGINASVLDRLGPNPTKLNVFQEVFDNNFWELFATETNRYAQQVIESEDTKKIDEEWWPVTVDELKAYMALSIIMTQVKKPCVQMNWSTRKIIHTPIFVETIPFRRFLAITRFIHFTNNDTADEKDMLNKVRSVDEYLNDKFRDMYTPEENVAIDESLMKFKGRLGCVVFCPKKRARYGVKFYKLCESKSGYCCGFKIYTGHDETVSDIDEIGLSGDVVRDLAQ